MTVPLAQQLAASAACAATSGEAQPASTVASALARGRQVAEHGRFVPLPVLLDVGAWLGSGPEPPLRDRPEQALLREYDAWLKDFCRAILDTSRLWRQPEDAFAAPVLLSDEAFLPLVMAGWAGAGGGRNGTSRQWAEAWTALAASEESTRKIHQTWRGRRSLDKGWEWWRDRKPARELPVHALLWALFATREPFFPERFDHAAGDLYLRAELPVLLPDQVRRIQQMKLLRREPEHSPEVRTAEEQDPWSGLVPLAALAADSLAEVVHRIENHETARLNSLVPNRYPRPVHVHLCWNTGFPAAAREHGNLVPASAGRGGGSATHAGSVAALTLLLLEDWRDALRGLPLRFHLHRGFSEEPLSFDLGPGEARWHAGGETRGLLPPAGVVAAVFARRSLAAAASTGLEWRVEAKIPRADWVCGCVAECDLPEMGFQLTPQTRRWTAQMPPPGGRPLLPAGVRHLITVDPPRGRGTICHAWFSPDGRICELRPLRQRLPQPAVPDPSFRVLRTNALEALLDVLAVRLH